MAKLRALVLLSTFIVVGIIGAMAIMYARGFRLSRNEGSFSLGPTGLLVINSDPNAAQVYVDGELQTATDSTISLSPGDYSIVVKKEGFLAWEKGITIEKEAVTQIDAFLLPAAPSLSALTFSGAVNPKVSRDNTKIAYIVPPNADNIEKAGLWVIESINLPLGFNRDPRQVTDGDLTEAEYEFSPDGREVLLTLRGGTFLIDLSEFTSQSARVNITSKINVIKEEWKKEQSKRLEARINSLPDEIEKIFARSAANVLFSPDENRILYTASGSATFPIGLVSKLPGSSTQTEERTTVSGKLYVYDIREDKNFPVASAGETIYWLPNSLNLVHPTMEGVKILDYDGTNENTVFSGSYTHPNAYATTSANRILILTNFASNGAFPNLYWLSLK